MIAGERTQLIDGEQALLRRWYFCKTLQAGARQAANYKIGQDFSALLRYRREGVLPSFEEVVLDSDVIMRLRRNDVRYKAIQNLMAMTIRQDLVSSFAITSDSRLHDHHIFPRAAHKKYGLPLEELDSISNRVPVLDETNLRLNESYPDRYMKDMRDIARSNGTLDDFARRMDDCLIPGNASDAAWLSTFKVEEFGDFCRHRAELMLKRIRQVVGDSLSVGKPSADEQAEEDDASV